MRSTSATSRNHYCICWCTKEHDLEKPSVLSMPVQCSNYPSHRRQALCHSARPCSWAYVVDCRPLITNVATLKPGCSSRMEDSDRLLRCPSSCFRSLPRCKCLICLNFHKVVNLQKELVFQRKLVINRHVWNRIASVVLLSRDTVNGLL